MEISSDMFLQSSTEGQWREGSAWSMQDNLWERFPAREIPHDSSQVVHKQLHSHPHLFFLVRASDVGALTVWTSGAPLKLLLSLSSLSSMTALLLDQLLGRSCDKINTVGLKNKNPNLMLSVPILLFKIQQWPENCINPFAVAQDFKSGFSVPSGKHLWDVFCKGVLFWFYSTPKMYSISLHDSLAFLKGIVEVTFLKVTLFLLLFWCSGASPALLGHNHKNPKPQPKTATGFVWNEKLRSVTSV